MSNGGEYRRRKLANAGKRTKQDRMPLPLVREISEADPLGRVSFGTIEAKQMAQFKGMTWRNFARSSVRPSGDTGYLEEDVEKILNGGSDVD